MKLYHGTSTACLGGIFRHGGLVCRDKRKAKSRWPEVPSHGTTVYLSAAYPLYFALNAVPDVSGWKNWPALVEVETSGLSLLPDEDYVGQVLWQGKERGEKLHPRFGNPKTLNELTLKIDPRDYPVDHLAQASIDGMGNCAVDGRVDLAHITRIAVLNPRLCKSILHRALDPSISILNYMVMGHTYRSLVGLVMDGTDYESHQINDAEFQADAARFLALLKTEREAGVTIFEHPFAGIQDAVKALQITERDTRDAERMESTASGSR